MKFAIALVCVCVATASAEFTAQQQSRLSQLLGEKSEIADLVAARGRRASHAGAPGVFDLSAQLQSLQDRFNAAVSTDAITSVIETTIQASISENSVLVNFEKDFRGLKDVMLGDIEKVVTAQEGELKVATDDIDALIDDSVKLLDDEAAEASKGSDALAKKLADFQAEVDKKLSALDGLEKKVGDSVDEELKPIASSLPIIDRLKLTYLNDPKIPVFRWNWWHTHQHGSTSWFDGNNPRGFGGVHPSHWTDGNHCANDMNGDFKYMKRLFIQHGTADKWGASICQECFFMHSSTTGRMCGSLWRIRNTKSSGVGWNPQFMYTSFGGWGEYASASLNGANNFRRHCNHSWCRTNINFNIPSNSAGDRISTVIFISSGSGDYYVHEGNYERAQAHHFNDNALSLPDGLEYVDDLDTVTGNWKQ